MPFAAAGIDNYPQREEEQKPETALERVCHKTGRASPSLKLDYHI